MTFTSVSSCGPHIDLGMAHTDGETEASGDEVICTQLKDPKLSELEWNPGLLSPNPVFLMLASSVVLSPRSVAQPGLGDC